jgi:DNA-binding FrmR family transcriptional regulator
MALEKAVAARFDAIEAQVKALVDEAIERQKKVEAMAATWIAAVRGAARRREEP